MNAKWKSFLAMALFSLFLLTVPGPRAAVFAQQSLSAPAAPAASPAPVDAKPLPVGKLTPEQLKAQQAAQGQNVRPAPASELTVGNPVPGATPEPKTPLDYLKNNEWQKHAEIRSGNVIFLRRSTDTPPAPNETVILRWRTPAEFSRSAFMSSKAHTPNQLPK